MGDIAAAAIHVDRKTLAGVDVGAAISTLSGGSILS